jgi:hypothetical protein
MARTYTGAQKCVVIDWKEWTEFEIVISCDASRWMIAEFLGQIHETWVIIIKFLLHPRITKVF